MAIGTPVNQGTAQASVNTQNITSLATIAAGDLIIGVTGFNSNNTGWSSLVDPSTNTYAFANGTTAPHVGFAYSPNVVGYASGSTQACTFLGAAASRATQIISVSGMNTNPLIIRDANAIPSTTSGTSTSSSLTSGAMAQKDNLVLLTLFTNTNNPGTVNWGSFTEIAGATSTRFIKNAYLVVSSAAPLVCPVSWTNSVAFRLSLQIFRGANASNTARPMGMTLGVGC